MTKTQLNFRIEEELLKAIKKEANRQGKNHTEWIIEQCQKGLDRHPLTLEELSDQLTNINERLTILEEQKNPKAINTEAINHPKTETKLTHAELARQLGVSSSTISRWSTGKRNPPEDLKYRFDRTLKLWIKNET